MADLKGLVQAGTGQNLCPGRVLPRPGNKSTDVLLAALREQLSHSRQVRSRLEGLREQLDGLEKTVSQVAGVVQLLQRLQHTRAWWSLQTGLCLVPCWNNGGA